MMRRILLAIVLLCSCTVKGKIIKVYDEERVVGFDGTTIVELEDGTRVPVKGKLGEVGETIKVCR